jgi:hypothetical protein
MALVSTQPLTEMSTRNLRGGKGRSALKALTISPPSVSRLSGKLGSLDTLRTYGLSWPVTGIDLLCVYDCYHCALKRLVTILKILMEEYFNLGARGSVVVKALCCKPECRGFKSR